MCPFFVQIGASVDPPIHHEEGEGVGALEGSFDLFKGAGVGGLDGVEVGSFDLFEGAGVGALEGPVVGVLDVSVVDALEGGGVGFSDGSGVGALDLSEGVADGESDKGCAVG